MGPTGLIVETPQHSSAQGPSSHPSHPTIHTPSHAPSQSHPPAHSTPVRANPHHHGELGGFGAKIGGPSGGGFGGKLGGSGGFGGVISGGVKEEKVGAGGSSSAYPHTFDSNSNVSIG